MIGGHAAPPTRRRGVTGNPAETRENGDWTMFYLLQNETLELLLLFFAFCAGATGTALLLWAHGE